MLFAKQTKRPPGGKGGRQAAQSNIKRAMSLAPRRGPTVPAEAAPDRLAGHASTVGFRIAPHDDPAERDADRMADDVLRSRGAELDGKSLEVGRDPVSPDRSARDSTERGTSMTTVARKASHAGDRGGEVGGNTRAMLRGLPTQPLGTDLRRFFEPRFGHSFAHVRIATGPQAMSAADQLRARAFSFGNTIGFARGAFAPDNHKGKQLIAHELAHQVQAGRGSSEDVVHRKEVDDRECAYYDSRSMAISTR